MPGGCSQHSHGLRQDPCSGPVAASEGQNFSPVLSPSDYKWQEISPRKNVLALPTPLPRPHLHTGMGRNTRVLLPLAAPPFLSTGPSSDSCPIILTPQGSQVRDCSCWQQHPSLLKHDFLVLLMHHFLLLPSQP